MGDKFRWRRPWRAPPLKERPVPRGPPPARPSPATARLLRESPMSASRRRAAAGEVFLGEVCKSKSILPYKAICPAYQKAGQPPWVARFFDSMGVFICNISTVAFAFYWPLTTGLCQLLIANCSIQSIPPQSIPPNTQKGRYYGATPSDRARPSISKSPPHPKEIPRRRPPGILYLQYRMQLGGPVSGKVWAGEAPEGPASP